MDDRKARIQQSKKFYLEYLKLMDHYKLITPGQKEAWKASESPETASRSTDPNADREAKIAAL